MSDIFTADLSSNQLTKVTSLGVGYAACRDAATGSLTTIFVIGQTKTSSYFQIYRNALIFDTSVIPDGATITDATLFLYFYYSFRNTEFDIIIQNGQPTYPHDPVVEADYDRTLYSGDGGSVTTVGIDTVEGWQSIPLNATGISWLNKTGKTKLLLRSSRDINGNEPTGSFSSEFVQFATDNESGKEPYIVVGYEGGDVDIDVPVCALSDISPLTPVVAAGVPGFQSISRFHVKQLVVDDDLNKFKTNLTYLKSLENAGLTPTYSNYINWECADGFNVSGNTTFKGISLTIDASLGTYSSVMSKGTFLPLVRDKITSIEFAITHFEKGNYDEGLFLILSDHNDVIPPYYFSTIGFTLAEVITGVIGVSSGVLGPPFCSSLGQMPQGDQFTVLKCSYNPFNWVKFYLNNKLIWSYVYSNPDSYLGTSVLEYTFAPYLRIQTFFNSGLDLSATIQRVLITQEY